MESVARKKDLGKTVEINKSSKSPKLEQNIVFYV